MAGNPVARLGLPENPPATSSATPRAGLMQSQREKSKFPKGAVVQLRFLDSLPWIAKGAT
jgi:hypothetical protein